MSGRSAGDAALGAMLDLVDGFAELGVSDACISPGSRSTPIVLAIARHGRIRVHVHLDERSSGFFAVGLAKATGRPALVVTTSGTAVANLLPAVVEAFMSRTPVLTLTADRPPELRGTGSNQTIEQIGIFGSYPRWSLDAPVPTVEGDPEGWRALGHRAFAEAMGPPGGPVHLNLPFAEPLVPSEAAPQRRGGAPASGRAHGMTSAGTSGSSPGPTDVPDGTIAIASSFVGAERGLVLAGSLDPWASEGDLQAIAELAEVLAWPLLAEPPSGLRRPPFALTAGQHLLMDEPFATAHPPDVVLQFGAAPTTRAAQSLVGRAGRLVVVSPSPAHPIRPPDPWIAAPLPHLIAARWLEVLEGRVAGGRRGGSPGRSTAAPPERTEWLAMWRRADRAARTAVDGALDGAAEAFEGRLARDLAAAIPGGSTLFVGSSMPVRDLDAYMAPRRGLRVLGNRGASGIDGSVSTALGIAAAEPRTFALIGDLAVLHDAGALLWRGRAVDPPVDPGSHVTFVVPNNRGGGIFDHLPVAREPESEELFVTPHRVSLEGIAAASGLRYRLLEHPEDLIAAVSTGAHEGDPASLVEVPIDRPAGMRIRAEIRSAVRDALASAI